MENSEQGKTEEPMNHKIDGKILEFWKHYYNMTIKREGISEHLIDCDDFVRCMEEYAILAVEAKEKEIEGPISAIIERRTNAHIAECNGLRDRIYQQKQFSDAKDKEILNLNEKIKSKEKIIYELETRCDPSGDIQTIASLTDHRDELVEKIEELKKQVKSWTMLYEALKSERASKDKEIAELNRQVSNWQLLHDLVKQENERKGKRLYELLNPLIDTSKLQ